MTRNTRIIGFLAVSAVAVALLAQSALGDSGATAVSALAAGIDRQAAATEAALALANDPWVPRVAGLGAGLAVGLVSGGVAAYVQRGETR